MFSLTQHRFMNCQVDARVGLFVLVLITLALLFMLPGCVKKRRKPPVPISVPGDEIRALSLRALQDQLKLCIPRDSCGAALFQLAGIKEIIGVVRDDLNEDLILFGKTDAEALPLELDDFVVALRNIWLKYAPLKGNVYQYSYPACSIDPNPKVIQKLNQLSEALETPTQGKETSAIDDWNRVCQRSQAVSVIGIPFDTHFAEVMVKADYDMKLIVDGSDSVDIPGLDSLMDQRVHWVQMQPGGKVNEKVSLNRFWFYPLRNIYEEIPGLVIIRESSVQLLTTRMPEGQPQAENSNSVDALANAFTQELTAVYPKLSRKRSVYAELENLFRFVAIAQIIKIKFADSSNSFDLSYLLEDYPLASTSVRRSVPGRPAVRRTRIDAPSAQYELWVTSCGGVDIRIEPEQIRFRKLGDDFSTVKQRVTSNRPNPNNAWYWVVSQGTTDLNALLTNNRRLYKLKQSNQLSRIFTVVMNSNGESARFRLYDGENTEEAASISELVDRINVRLMDHPVQIVYIDLQNALTPDKIAAFASSCRIAQSRRNKEVKIITLPKLNNSDHLAETLFERGLRFDESRSGIEEVREGKRKGWFKATLSFFVTVGNAVKTVVVYAYARTRESIQRFFDAVRNSSTTVDFRTSSVSDVLHQIRKDLGEEVFLIFVDETGDIEISKLTRWSLADITS